MGNLFRAEWFKLMKDPVFRLLITVLVAVSALYPLLMFFDTGDPVLMDELYMYNILGGNNYVIRLVPCVLAGFFISSEYSSGTMKSIAASGNSRPRIYTAKLIVYSAGSVLIALVLPVVMTGVSSLYFGFDHMPELDYYVQTIGLTMLYAAAFASIMALFSSIFTDSGRAIAFLLLFFLLIDSILYLLASKLALFEFFFNYSIFKLLVDVPRILMTDSTDWFALLSVPALTFAVFGLLGSWLYNRKEIK
ncbi:ABC transporter permease [Paenibacillus sp. MMS20-IR301]|uniref:ABC transporter permease n=1 Tax=Paenibacillus sp. MMS20-IR301 TaxID=2895946 RepID=UPI0028EA7FCA|nr:ABC transporter permease [Paenibacillus sp. MMS20-IR301]WNS42335.1 ABC transporter permease [Paenibacillus sp. MMS20-IR301]